MTQSVLVIDDSPDIHKLLAFRLREEGLVLHHALSADEGIEKGRQVLPDLILLDIDMPQRDGFSACRQLKADSMTRPIPIIFLTAATQTADKVRGFELGGIDYITKPFEPLELRVRVRSALRTKRYHDLLSSRSQIDGLTGLWNRTHCEKRLEEELGAHARFGRRVWLVLMRLECIREINEVHGRAFADLVLVQVAEMLTRCLQKPDAVFRSGGNTFALLLQEAERKGVASLGERIRDQLAKLGIEHRKQPVAVTACFGLASPSGAGNPTARTLFNGAEQDLCQDLRTSRKGR